MSSESDVIPDGDRSRKWRKRRPEPSATRQQGLQVSDEEFVRAAALAELDTLVSTPIASAAVVSPVETVPTVEEATAPEPADSPSHAPDDAPTASEPTAGEAAALAVAEETQDDVLARVAAYSRHRSPLESDSEPGAEARELDLIEPAENLEPDEQQVSARAAKQAIAAAQARARVADTVAAEQAELARLAEEERDQARAEASAVAARLAAAEESAREQALAIERAEADLAAAADAERRQREIAAAAETAAAQAAAEAQERIAAAEAAAEAAAHEAAETVTALREQLARAEAGAAAPDAAPQVSPAPDVAAEAEVAIEVAAELEPEVEEPAREEPDAPIEDEVEAPAPEPESPAEDEAVDGDMDEPAVESDRAEAVPAAVVETEDQTEVEDDVEALVETEVEPDPAPEPAPEAEAEPEAVDALPAEVGDDAEPQAGPESEPEVDPDKTPETPAEAEALVDRLTVHPIKPLERSAAGVENAREALSRSWGRVRRRRREEPAKPEVERVVPPVPALPYRDQSAPEESPAIDTTTEPEQVAEVEPEAAVEVAPESDDVPETDAAAEPDVTEAPDVQAETVTDVPVPDEPEVDESEVDEADPDESGPDEPDANDSEATPEPEPGKEALAALPADVVRAATISGASHQPYLARRRGSTGIVAAVLALAGVVTIVVMAIGGSLSDQVNLAVGIGIATFLAALLAYRRIGRSSTVSLSEEGQLLLEFGDAHHTFDLSTDSTQLEMVGHPGDAEWTIRLLRRGLSPIEVDASSVDPALFTEALRQWRPDL